MGPFWSWASRMAVGRGFGAVKVCLILLQTSPATSHSSVKQYSPAFMRPILPLCIHAKFISGAQKGGMGKTRFACFPDTIGRSPQEQTSEFWKLWVYPMAEE